MEIQGEIFMAAKLGRKTEYYEQKEPSPRVTFDDRACPEGLGLAIPVMIVSKTVVRPACAYDSTNDGTPVLRRISSG